MHYNGERPNEALNQDCPETVYAYSDREYQEPGDVEYPSEFEVRMVKGNGVFNWRGQVVFLREALGREAVGLAEVADGSWAVHSCRRALGIVDERRRKVYDAGEAVRKVTISASALRSPWSVAEGAPEGPDNV